MLVQLGWHYYLFWKASNVRDDSFIVVHEFMTKLDSRA